MMRKFLFLVLATCGLFTAGFANNDLKSSVGVVNFSTVVIDSKLGKQEQASFESIKTQMGALLEETEKKINEMTAKFNDSEFMDALSPEGEDELKTKYKTHTEELSRYQSQYYQVLQQANMKIVQSLGAAIQEASEQVAKNKKLSLVFNKEGCFYYAPALDVTNLVVVEMDKTFDQKNPNKGANAPQAKEAPKGETPAPASKMKEAPKVETPAPASKMKGK